MDFSVAEFDRANKVSVVVFIILTLLFFLAALAPFDFEKYMKGFPFRWFFSGIGLFYLILMLFIAGWAPAGYKLMDTEFVVRRRFFGKKRYPLQLFESVENADGRFKAATQKVSGTAGLLGYFGGFRNREWGKFEAQATNSKKALIILGSKKLLVSPREPELFKEILTAKLHHKNR
jgi:hypothetical protein